MAQEQEQSARRCARAEGSAPEFPAGCQWVLALSRRGRLAGSEQPCSRPRPRASGEGEGTCCDSLLPCQSRAAARALDARPALRQCSRLGRALPLDPPPRAPRSRVPSVELRRRRGRTQAAPEGNVVSGQGARSVPAVHQHHIAGVAGVQQLLQVSPGGSLVSTGAWGRRLSAACHLCLCSW